MMTFKRGKAKDWFFDRRHVIDRVGAMNARLLAIAGSRVRRSARKYIRPRRRMTEAAYQRLLSPQQAKRRRMTVRIAKETGSPSTPLPYMPSQPGEAPRSITGLLRNRIFFAMEEDRETVVIGPELISDAAGPSALEALEYGGNTTLTGGPDKGRTVRMAARPFMNPALQREAEGIAELWRGRL